MLVDAGQITVTNPGTGEVLGAVPAMSVDEVDAVVAAANRAQRRMAAMPAHERAALLLRVADLMAAEQDNLGRMLAAENGKPVRQTRDEVAAAIRIFRGYAGEATRLFGRQIPLDAVPGLERHLALTMREPLGVVAALVPFNYPVELYAHKAAAALAAGNAVVVQAPAKCPLTLGRVDELVRAAGVPADAHQLVTGDVRVSQRLAASPGIAAISLTGSTTAGRAIAQHAAGTLKKVMLELGGNDALIVLSDADVEEAAGRSCWAGWPAATGRSAARSSGSTSSAGCTTRSWTRWPPRRPNCASATRCSTRPTSGRSSPSRPREQVQAAVGRLVADGARLVAGGSRRGAFVDPTVLVDVPPASPALREEIFGPVAPVARFDDPAEAVAMANESPFGLHAAVFTRDISRAFSLARALDVGGVIINGSTALRAENLPFGGTKDTGGYREGLHETVLDLTRQKTVVVMGAFGEPA